MAVDFDQIKLADLYASKQRPLCQCKTPGVEMYIAKIGDQYIVKRMPNSGALHAPECDSYEPPPELSGLGEVMGSAIRENAENGITELRFGFSLARCAGRAVAPQQGDREESDSVVATPGRLGLRATLHYLWEEAGLARHISAEMEQQKRPWNAIRTALLRAAGGKVAKGQPLAEHMFIPSSFPDDKRESVKQAWLRMASLTPKGKLRIMVGQVKQFVPTRYGYRMQINHSPDTIFSLSDDLHKRTMKRFEKEVELSEIEGVRLVAIAVYGVNAAGIAIVEELSLMTTTGEWIPFDGILEKALIDKMVEERRPFTKGLRYNLPKSKPLACAVLTDTQPQPTALYIVPGPQEKYGHEELSMLQADSQLASWSWDADQFEIPCLPTTAGESMLQA